MEQRANMPCQYGRFLKEIQDLTLPWLPGMTRRGLESAGSLTGGLDSVRSFSGSFSGPLRVSHPTRVAPFLPDRYEAVGKTQIRLDSIDTSIGADGYMQNYSGIMVISSYGFKLKG